MAPATRVTLPLARGRRPREQKLSHPHSSSLASLSGLLVADVLDDLEPFPAPSKCPQSSVAEHVVRGGPVVHVRHLIRALMLVHQRRLPWPRPSLDVHPVATFGVSCHMWS
jgi:hypothetical protein